MTAAPITPTDAAGLVADPLQGRIWIVRDSWTEATRHLEALPGNPELLVFAALQPIMFVVLFVYVFGGSISVPGYSSYEQYVAPGIFAQTVLFGSIYTGLGIAEDLSKGFVDRLRSLRMFSSAVLVGRTMSDVVRNALYFTVMLAVAFVIGFRFQGSLAGAAAAALISSAFVSPANMPGWLQPIAEHNPVTIVTDASRALYNGRDPGNDPWIAPAWAARITIVFATLSVRKYRTTTSR